MTNNLLIFGCAVLAFSPLCFLFFTLCYSKAHLMIVATTSAFAYLISLLISSLLWLPFSSYSSVLLLVLPAVVTQQAARCAFVAIYHVVEGAITASINAHERQQQQEQQQQQLTHDGDLQQEQHHERNLMRLELNDWSCGIAAGIGFGTMHALMLYGTLLASEASTLGTLYQPSCPQIPSLVNSALNTMLFSFIDILLMLFAFYGMRRRKSKSHKQRQAGNMTLGTSLLIHSMASFATTANLLHGGCRIALPLLAIVLLIAAAYLQFGIRTARFLPKPQQVR